MMIELHPRSACIFASVLVYMHDVYEVYVCMVIAFSRIWIDWLWLRIMLLVVS